MSRANKNPQWWPDNSPGLKDLGVGVARSGGAVGKRRVTAGLYRATITATDAAGNKSKLRRAKVTLKTAAKRKLR